MRAALFVAMRSQNRRRQQSLNVTVPDGVSPGEMIALRPPEKQQRFPEQRRLQMQGQANPPNFIAPANPSSSVTSSPMNTGVAPAKGAISMKASTAAALVVSHASATVVTKRDPVAAPSRLPVSDIVTEQEAPSLHVVVVSIASGPEY